MRASLSTLCISLCLLLSVGCAGTYSNIYPTNLTYNNSTKSQGVEFSYKYDVLSERGNKKFAKKERKSGYRVVAIKITNYRDRPLTFGSDIKLYQSGKEAYLVDPIVMGQEIKQNPPIYLLYLLMVFVNVQVDDGFTRTVYPVGLLLGPGLTAGNMGTAYSANQKFRRELSYHNPIGKVIGPGETYAGLIGIRDEGFNPLTIQVFE